MSPQFSTKVKNKLINLLFSALLTYSCCHGASSENTKSGILCAESEREALLQFKHNIRIDNCGHLDTWEDGLDCCQWNGIRCNRSGHVIRLHLRGIEGSDYHNYRGCLEGTLSHSLLELKHLKYIDLSLNHFRGQLPKFIGSFANLEHLNLSNAGFEGIVPQEIGNLSRLSSLDLNRHLYYGDSTMRVESLGWLSHLRLLKQLDLGNIDLSIPTTSWLQIVNNLPFLQVLRLDKCHLSLKISSSLSYKNASSTLNVISLSDNNMNDTTIFDWLLNLKGLDTSLVHLDLSASKMFGNNTQVSGQALKFLGSLCSLQYLHLIDTNLKYDFSKIVQSFSGCSHKALMSLDLSTNQIWGSIPDNINILSSLRELNLDGTQLNGTISKAIGALSMLERLSLDSNFLKGVVTEDHLSNLSKLRRLDLGYNELVVNISSNWTPPFQLDYLSLDSCKVGPDFPMWLITQKNLSFISLYNASIYGTVPLSFFNSLSSKLAYLSLARNMMHGVLPDVSITFDFPPQIELSWNKFHGAIPPFLRNVLQLHLNDNSFSQGLVPFLCQQNKTPIVSLDLSHNSFSEELPDCWGNFEKLQSLNLQNNKLWGNLSTSIGALDKLTLFYLGDNNISGEIPSSLVNCKSLVSLDLSHNSLTGHIPTTFWDSFKNLSILTLQSNKLVGALPSSFCHLSQIQILDLSSNLLNGTIPRCIYNLKGMANTNDALESIIIQVSPLIKKDSYDSALIMWKRIEECFQGYSTVGQAKAIDLSNNKLEGQIPEGISSLTGLVSINLSRNHLSGAITSKIGQMTSLEVLDLSHNHLSGKIPTSLAKITTLDMLDLSHNNFSGKIPTGTQLQSFDYSTYMENPGLCGAPLPKCEGDEATTTPQNKDDTTPHKEHHIDEFMLGLYISLVVGFIMGFWGVCGTLVLKGSRRHGFFRFFHDMQDRIYGIMFAHITRVWRQSLNSLWNADTN